MSETLPVLYVIQLADGSYWPGKAHRRRVDCLTGAKFYKNAGPAKGAITYHSIKGAKLRKFALAEVTEEE